MTQITQAYWLAVHRQVARYQADVQRALLKAFDVLSKGMNERQLAEFLGRGGVDRFILDTVPEADLARAFGPMRKQLQTVVSGAAHSTTRLLPARVDKAGLVAFDVLNPKVIDAIKNLDTRVMNTLRDTVRDSVREKVQLGLAEGLGSKEIARDLRGVVGLAPNQVKAVNNFEKMLRSGDSTALTRSLRDRRFDKTLEKAFANGKSLSGAQVTKMVNQYRSRFIAFHAETISRTASLDAVKLGQRLTWEGAIDAGMVRRERMMKRWVGIKDDREREEHLEMEGEEVPFDQAFSNGQEIPGDDDYNCRCVAFYFEADTDQRVERARSVDDLMGALSDRADGVIGSIRMALEGAQGASVDELVAQLQGYFPEKAASALRSTASTQVSRLAKSTGRQIVSVVEPGRGRVYRFTTEPYIPKPTAPKPVPVAPPTPTPVPTPEPVPPKPLLPGERLQIEPIGLQWSKSDVAMEQWKKLNVNTQTFLRKHQLAFAEGSVKGSYGAYYPQGKKGFGRPTVTISKSVARQAKQGTLGQARSTLGHEIGHAVDDAMGKKHGAYDYWSGSQHPLAIKFRAALEDELQWARSYRGGSVMDGRSARNRYEDFIDTAYGRGRLDSYAYQNSRHKEIVADMFNAIRMGNPVRGGRWSIQQMEDMFPKSIAIFREALTELGL